MTRAKVRTKRRARQQRQRTSCLEASKSFSVSGHEGECDAVDDLMSYRRKEHEKLMEVLQAELESHQAMAAYWRERSQREFYAPHAPPMQPPTATPAPQNPDSYSMDEGNMYAVL